MTDIMFDIPSRDDVSKCVITRETIEEEKTPELVIAEKTEESAS